MYKTERFINSRFSINKFMWLTEEKEKKSYMFGTNKQWMNLYFWENYRFSMQLPNIGHMANDVYLIWSCHQMSSVCSIFHKISHIWLQFTPGQNWVAERTKTWCALMCKSLCIIIFRKIEIRQIISVHYIVPLTTTNTLNPTLFRTEIYT